MGALWKIIGSAAGELAFGVIEALARGDDWEPLVDAWGEKLKIRIAQETTRKETVDELTDMRKRILGED
jgi:hypothetical protein